MKRKIVFQFNGKVYMVNVERFGNEIVIEHDGEIYKINLIPDELENGEREIIPVRTNLSTSLTPSDAGTYNDDIDNSGLLLSPMAGIINEIKVTVEQKVTKGDVVIILEAMKMYIDIHAPITGIVKEIFIKNSDSISINQKLIKIEPGNA